MLNKILQPLLSIKAKYIPLLTIYLANSFAAFSQIAEMFWIKDSLTLSSSELISITIWSNLPWSLKILFGQILDSVKILGSQRKIYIYIAACLMLCGNIIVIGVANEYSFITSISSIYKLLIFSGIFIQIGFVLQDLVADTLCYDTVDKKNKSDQQIKEEISNLQILARIVDISGAIIAVSISGIIAAKFSYGTVSYAILAIAAISILGSIMIKKEPIVPKNNFNLPILAGGILYLFVAVLVTSLDLKYSQEIAFLAGALIISSALYHVCIHLTPQRKREVFSILIVIFTCRAIPTHPPGIKWWQIDELGFTPDFYATISQVSTILGLIGLVLLAKYIINSNLGRTLLLLNTLNVIFQLPMIGISFGFHEWTMKNFGFGAQTITLVDNIMEAPFLKLKFLILCTIATYYAPKENIASWFALVMSIMSLAYVSGGRILKKIISDIYVIERGCYENVPELMIVTTLIGFIMPTLAILIFMNPFSKSK